MVDLAREALVSRQTISAYESGQQTPGPDLLERLAGILNFRTSFFMWPMPAMDRKGPTFYRSMASATKSARERASVPHEWLVDLRRYISRWIEIPKVDFPVFQLPSDLARLSDDMIEDYATKTRRHWGMGDGPIGNVSWLAENKGAIVARVGLDADKLDGQSEWIDGRPHILLSADKCSAVRSRFDMAHEIGHIILHREVDRGIVHRSAEHKLIEDQANTFASAFLLPQKTFTEEVHSPSLDQFRVLKERWMVSIGTMLMRAVHLGLVPEKRAEYLWISYSRKGWRKWEPMDDDLPIEQPRLFRQALNAILNNRLQVRDDVLSEIPLGQGYLEELMSLQRGFFNLQEAEIITLPVRSDATEASNKSDTRGDVIEFHGRPRR